MRNGIGFSSRRYLQRRYIYVILECTASYYRHSGYPSCRTVYSGFPDAETTMIDASKQTVSILAIDKKKLKIGDSGLPKMVIDQTPWYMKWAKLPIVKAKIGPKVVTMIADEKVFLQLPLRTEAKVVISGLYITEIKSVRGGIPPLPKKKKFFDRFKKNTEEAAKKEASKSKKNK